MTLTQSLSELPPMESLVPHRGAMLLVDRAIEADDEHAVAEVVVPPDGLFARDGRVPAWVGLEYMAQTIGVWAGTRAKAAGRDVDIGFLLGTRRYTCSVSEFPAGTKLRMEVRCELIAANGLGHFDCRLLQDGIEVATAQLSVFQPPEGGVAHLEAQKAAERAAKEAGA